VEWIRGTGTEVLSRMDEFDLTLAGGDGSVDLGTGGGEEVDLVSGLPGSSYCFKLLFELLGPETVALFLP